MKESSRRWIALAFGTAILLGTQPDASAAEFSFKVAHTNAPGEIQDQGVLQFKSRLEELTNGRATLENFPNGQLGAELPAVQSVLLGTVDMTVPGNAAFSNFVPHFRVFDFPFLFRDPAHFEGVVSGAVFEELRTAAAARGFRLLGIFNSGTRHIMTKSPVNSISDLKNKKIRTVQNPIHVEAFKAFGANATPLAYNELYGALQAGVVDGADAANTNYWAQKFYEVAPSWALVSWLIYTAPVVMSEKTFQGLPKDIQAALEKAGAESATWQRQLAVKSEGPLLEQIKAKGVQVTTPDREPFRKASEALYDKMLTKPEEKSLLATIQHAK
jgi:TRAP-type transport system periplasmic protein